MNLHHKHLTPAQTTGADRAFFGLVQSVGRRSLAARGYDARPPESARGGEVQAMISRLLALYPEFQRIYAELFVKHIGATHSEEVLHALQTEPMQRYLKARAAMAGELAQGLAQLKARMRASSI